MDKPKRSEIWRVKLGSKRQGKELDADDPQGERPCLIVSADDYNDIKDALTVVPLTHYREVKEDRRSLWAVTIVNRENVHIDPHIAQYPTNQRLRTWETDEHGNYLIETWS